MGERPSSGDLDDRTPAERDRDEALARIVSAIDVYLYTNEHLPDGSRRSVYSGPNRERLMGGVVPAGADVATEWERLIHPDDWDEHLAHRARLRAGQPSEVRYRLRGYDGVTRWIHARTVPHEEDGRLFVDGVVADVTAAVEAEHALLAVQEELRRQVDLNLRQALHDELTGLGNRRKLLVELEQAVDEASDDDPWLLTMFDLDGFKLYNDSFGHAAGDALLARLGSRLRSAAPDGSETYRLGGDEFCVLTPLDGSDVETLLDCLTTALSESGDAFAVSASFGAAFLPADGLTPAEALGTADHRLYVEKRSRHSRRGRPLDVLVQALHEREPDLHGHAREVEVLARAVAERLELDPDTVERTSQSALMHDVGKIAIPDSILHKPGPLDDEEWAFVRSHTLIGERILAASPALTAVARIVRSTHERWDGAGYPDSLAGEAIPIEARIIAVCDSLSAISAERTYSRHTAGDALDEVRAGAGTQFDPAVVEAVLAVVRDGVVGRR
jgi:diguanylate cyclase (GGDEF)-like protein